MQQIYSQCSQVVLWLGADLVLQRPGVYPRRYRLSDLEVSASPQLPNKRERQSSLQQRLNIAKLLERRYFSRVWVIQELILAPRLILPIGSSIFWADATTLRNLDRSVRRSWEGTKAPWFKHLAEGALRVSDIFELMALTSKSQATDARDKLFGVLGLYTKQPEETVPRPDYSLSCQHIFIGFFAHCIINQRGYQLLSKATGTHQGPSSLTWIPEWKSQSSWEKTFQSSITQLKQPEEKVVALAAHALIKNWSSSFGINRHSPLVWFIHRNHIPDSKYGTPPAHNGYQSPVYKTRAWFRNASINADTGALSLNMTRLISIKSPPSLLGQLCSTAQGSLGASLPPSFHGT